MADDETEIIFDEFTDASLSTPPPGLDNGSPGGFPFTDAQRSFAHYNDYSIDSSYEWESGLLQVPVAGPPGSPSVLIQVHAPYSRKTVSWNAQRYGLKPLLPSANTGNANEVLYNWVCSPQAPVLSATGTPQYAVSGQYEYYNVLPIGSLTSLPSGKLGGIDVTASSVYDLLPFQFDSSMLLSSATPAGFPLPPGF